LFEPTPDLCYILPETPLKKTEYIKYHCQKLNLRNFLRNAILDGVISSGFK
jgi:hypothetical protein